MSKAPQNKQDYWAVHNATVAAGSLKAAQLNLHSVLFYISQKLSQNQQEQKEDEKNNCKN